MKWVLVWIFCILSVAAFAAPPKPAPADARYLCKWDTSAYGYAFEDFENAQGKFWYWAEDEAGITGDWYPDKIYSYKKLGCESCYEYIRKVYNGGGEGSSLPLKIFLIKFVTRQITDTDGKPIIEGQEWLREVHETKWRGNGQYLCRPM